ARATSRHSSRRSSASRRSAATSRRTPPPPPLASSRRAPAVGPFQNVIRRSVEMGYYRRVGEVPPKRHTQFRRPDGGLYAEELMGEEGFTADAALLYHRGIPSALVDARPWELP